MGMKIEALYLWQIWIIRTVALICTIAFVLFLVWEFGYRFAAIVRVLLGVNPNQDDMDIYYTLRYRLLNPFATSADVRRLVNQKIHEEGNESDDEELSESDEEYDDDAY